MSTPPPPPCPIPTCTHTTRALVAKQCKVVGECEMYKEERDVLEDMETLLEECDMEELGTLDCKEKAMAIPGDRWWPQVRWRNRKGIRLAAVSMQFMVDNVTVSAQLLQVPLVLLGGASVRSRNRALSRRDACVVNGQINDQVRQKTK